MVADMDKELMNTQPNETTALWSATHAERQAKREDNRESSADLLRAAGIEFEERNKGAHLIVNNARLGEVIDFWPGTGLWIPRTPPHKRGRGVVKLIARCHAISEQLT